MSDSNENQHKVIESNTDGNAKMNGLHNRNGPPLRIDTTNLVPRIHPPVMTSQVSNAHLPKTTNEINKGKDENITTQNKKKRKKKKKKKTGKKKKKTVINKK